MFGADFAFFWIFLVQQKLDASAFTVILCNQPLKSEGDVFIWKTDLSKKSFGTLPPSKNEKFKNLFFKKIEECIHNNLTPFGGELSVKYSFS